MKLDRSRVGRRLLAVAAAFGLGLLVMAIGVAVVNSRVLVGLSIVWILAVLFYSVRVFRCPLCGAALLYFPIRVALRWLRSSPRLCPRCRTDYDAALAELGRGKRRSS